MADFKTLVSIQMKNGDFYHFRPETINKFEFYEGFQLTINREIFTVKNISIVLAHKPLFQSHDNDIDNTNVSDDFDVFIKLYTI